MRMLWCVVGANPPLHVVDGFIKRIWKDLNVDEVGMVNKGVFLVRFNRKQEHERACGMTGPMFDKKTIYHQTLGC